MIKAGLFKQREVLQAATQSDNLARKHLSLMLLGQLGDAEALVQFGELNQSDRRERDQVRYMLLGTALQFDFNTIGPWALQVAAEPDANRKLATRALKTALRFNAPGAVELWKQRFSSTTDLAQLMRLSLIAIQLAPWLDGQLYQIMAGHDDERISRLGKSALSVVNKKNVADGIVAVIDLDYAPANRWAMSYALHHAAPADAAQIHTAFIRAYERTANRNRARRLEDAVLATQSLYELDSTSATALLRPILEDEQTPVLLTQGILLGLIRCGVPSAHQVINDLPPFKNDDASQLALLLRARYGQGLGADDLGELALMVRGGGLRKGALRIQAAWLYLKITNQTDAALAQMLGE